MNVAVRTPGLEQHIHSTKQVACAQPCCGPAGNDKQSSWWTVLAIVATSGDAAFGLEGAELEIVSAPQKPAAEPTKPQVTSAVDDQGDNTVIMLALKCQHHCLQHIAAQVNIIHLSCKVALPAQRQRQRSSSSSGTIVLPVKPSPVPIAVKKKQGMVSAKATLVALKAQYDRLQQDYQQLQSRDTELLLELLR